MTKKKLEKLFKEVDIPEEISEEERNLFYKLNSITAYEQLENWDADFSILVELEGGSVKFPLNDEEVEKIKELLGGKEKWK